jgi:hypothetical protein
MSGKACNWIGFVLRKVLATHPAIRNCYAREVSKQKGSCSMNNFLFSFYFIQQQMINERHDHSKPFG